VIRSSTMAGDEPLLARPSSDNSSDRNIEEEDALLTGQHINRPTARTSRQKWREIGLFAWAMIATVAVIVLTVVYQHESSVKQTKSKWGPDGKPTGKRNMIFMVSDGMGPTSLSMTRSFRQYTSGLPVDDVLVLDQYLIGSSRTRSTSSLITDSAAGATAFSCGLKSYNGAISVLPDHSPCGTVLEAAKKAGYMTGLVVTTRITDATPACFASHANRREYEDLIAEQLVGHYPLGRVVDLILGGGRCHFLPNSTEGSCRADDKDVVQMAKKNGYSYIDNRDDFDNLAADVEGGVKLPLLGLIAERDVPYEIDRVHVAQVYPSQAEMTKLALKALSAATRDSDKGFFIMIEGSRIDHAGHANDAAAQVHEVLAHDKAFAAALQFLDEDETPGVLVSTSDHETGGLATAKQLHPEYPHYVWYPSQLVNVTHSTEYLARAYAQYLAEEGDKASRSEKAEFLRSKIIFDGMGITDASDEEIGAIIDAEPIWPPFYLFGDMVSRRTQVGWSTHGHSGKSELLCVVHYEVIVLTTFCVAVDVNIYASSPEDAPGLMGNHENIEVGQFIADYLDVELEPVTEELKKKGVKQGSTGTADDADVASGTGWGEWMGPPGLPNNENGQLVYLDTYHGDFKHRKREEEAFEGCECGLRH
jgi:alkaline phosphatase